MLTLLCLSSLIASTLFFTDVYRHAKSSQFKPSVLATPIRHKQVKTLYLVRHGEAVAWRESHICRNLLLSFRRTSVVFMWSWLRQVHNIKEKQAQLNAKQQALSDGLTPSSGEFQAR